MHARQFRSVGDREGTILVVVDREGYVLILRIRQRNGDVSCKEASFDEIRFSWTDGLPGPAFRQSTVKLVGLFIFTPRSTPGPKTRTLFGFDGSVGQT